jgi:putative hydrolase of HD superfamily
MNAGDQCGGPQGPGSDWADGGVAEVGDSTVDAVVRLGGVALDFGRVDRITYHPDGETPESDTTHTVMLGLLACSLAQRWFPGLRVGLVAQYALVHDVVEVYAGDTPTLRTQGADEKAAKQARERAAMMRLQGEFTGHLPWMPWMISTYEDLATPEARFVKLLDKLLPKITHILNGAVTIERQGMTRAELVARYEAQGRELDRYASEFPEVEELRRHLVDRVLEQIDARSDH